METAMLTQDTRAAGPIDYKFYEMRARQLRAALFASMVKGAMREAVRLFKVAILFIGAAAATSPRARRHDRAALSPSSISASLRR
jgi:hypothetical protein